MQCKCGAEAIHREHEVKTIGKAKEWIEEIKPEELPVIVSFHKCMGCGRIGERNRRSIN